ncbi:MAG: response regulator [Merismopedia sp. SIO2A8]|nr:response regulator [Symploca sp. SIO2B6]NET47739.1 response regulator [Merismopedia sp. SIO2A8]
MSKDKELEIQLQFLEEAQEYLDTIESVLVGLASSAIDGHKMDAVLRAAHSVKGGAGMMGYQTLSQLAHRLEDAFKVLKAQRNSIEVDAELESLLLRGVDHLRQVLELNRQQREVEPVWLEKEVEPVLAQLRWRLGEPVADDANTMLGPEEGANVAALLFETEVEGCLTRLETVLADPQAPCLEEELSIMAQELEGLGEMLQLGAFSSLCRAVIERLAMVPEQVMETAQLALQAWRRSQALVLVGQTNNLPMQLESVGNLSTPSTTLSTSTDSSNEELPDNHIPAEELPDNWRATPLTEPVTEVVEDHSIPTETLLDSWQELQVIAAEFENSHPVAKAVPAVTQEDILPPEVAELWPRESVSAQLPTESVGVNSSSSPLPHSHIPSESVFSPTNSPEAPPLQVVGEVPSSEYGSWAPPGSQSTHRWQEVNSDVPSSSDHRGEKSRETPLQENTVRIPVRQLDRLSDLFGELTIERNGLSLHLGRLRQLMETLKSRVSTLEQLNARLRTTYDQVATGANAVGLGLTASSQSLAWLELTQPRLLLPEITPQEHQFNREFDALEMDRYCDLHLLSQEVMETIVQIQEVTTDLELGLEDSDQSARQLNRTSKQLQTNLTRVRMRPLSDLVGRFSRALRDLCLQYHKQVELKVVGKGTLIDRTILEALCDPLMHLVRNAFDHGIESPQARQAQGKSPQGIIEIKAAHRGNHTLITVSDDGNGINLEKIRSRAQEMGLDAELLAAASVDDLLSLIFEPGFSTAEEVTALSGRGVGMDVVRNNLKDIRGEIRVDTVPGRGTTFTLTVPFTLSVARILLVESNGMLLALPTDVVEEMILLQPEEILTTVGNEFLQWEGKMVSLKRLGSMLQFNCPRRVVQPEGTPGISEPTVMMIAAGEQLVAVQVDRCWGEREVAIRQVEGTLAMPPGFVNCAILGDGQVVPVVDASEMLRSMASYHGCNDGDVKSLPPQPVSAADGAHGNVYGVQPWARHTLVSTAVASNGVSPTPFAPVPQRILPQGHQGFDQVCAYTPPAGDVCSHHQDTILVVDDSINVRRFLALALQRAGYFVEQAKDGQDALEKLLSGLLVQAVICDIEMPRLDGYGFLARIKSEPSLTHLPIAMLTSRSGDKHRQLAMSLGASAYFSKPYNERILLKTLEDVIGATKVPA